MFKLIFLLAFSTLITALHIVPLDDESNSRAVGGMVATITQAPWQVSVHYLNEHQCGGSILSKEWVITAAHCVTAAANFYMIRAGSVYHNSLGSIHSVDRIIKHEFFTTNKYGFHNNDIALVHVAEIFILDTSRQAIPLYNVDEVISTSTKAQVTGWGDVVLATNTLQLINTYIITKINCNTTYSRYGGIYDNQSCIGETTGNPAACRTDAGGPVVLSKRLAGIISWSEGCGRPTFPSVFTEVSHYRLWIKRYSGV
ncbi:trypsin-1-like [Microplitis demolitor]|uniref:trypsin-1-like n=1 Tax=Microplitis demolitor TaxID=69319 RepID=UPI0004CD981A|nr:trypsin-1-like [Microplitis demolitor]